MTSTDNNSQELPIFSFRNVALIKTIACALYGLTKNKRDKALFIGRYSKNSPEIADNSGLIFIGPYIDIKMIISGMTITTKRTMPWAIRVFVI